MLSVGRFLLTGICHRIGEKRAVVGLIASAAVFQSLVWAVPNIITNAVAESIVGLFLGPVYPCSMAVFAMLWPRNIQIGSLGLVSSMGSAGGAFARGPLMTAKACMPKVPRGIRHARAGRA